MRSVAAGRFDESGGTYSPNGAWIAYLSDESGRAELYARPTNGSGRWQISIDGATAPRWIQNEIVFRRGKKIMSARVQTVPEFSADTPRALFEGDFDFFDVTADGERFVVVERKADVGASQLNVVLNWFEDVGQRVQAAATR